VDVVLRPFGCADGCYRRDVERRESESKEASDSSGTVKDFARSEVSESVEDSAQYPVTAGAPSGRIAKNASSGSVIADLL
jgi:hypothetical protein